MCSFGCDRCESTSRRVSERPSHVTFLEKLYFLRKIEENVILHCLEQELSEQVA